MSSRMKHLPVLFGFLLASTALGGCAGPRAKSPDELFASMSLELSQALEQGHPVKDDGLTIGMTTLTSETVLRTVDAAADEPAMGLPDERGSLSKRSPGPVRTWGISSAAPSGVPAVRETE
jgi:hypothetical protein